MVTWKRSVIAESLGHEHGVEVVELSTGESVALRNSRFHAVKSDAVVIPLEEWLVFVEAVKNGEFDELPRRKTGW